MNYLPSNQKNQIRIEEYLSLCWVVVVVFEYGRLPMLVLMLEHYVC